MFLRGNHAGGNLRPWVQLVIVEVTQFETGNEQTAQALVEVSLLDVTALHGSRQVLVFRAALHIGTAQYGLTGSSLLVFGNIVPLGEEIADGTAVAGNQSLESP